MNKDFLVQEKISDNQKDFLEKVMKLGIDFLDSNKQDKAFQYECIDNLKNIVSSKLPVEPKSFPELLETLEMVTKFSISQSDSRYLAFPDTGNSIASIAADILNTFLNQNLIAVDRSAPIATLVEIQLIMWLREIIGYDFKEIKNLSSLSEIGGMWTSGGNMSNYTAVLGALYSKYPEVKKKGIQSLKKKPVILLAKGLEHYSFKGAVESLGIGSESLIWVESTPEYTMDISSLEYCIKNLDDSMEIIMVVAVAGNCRTSSVDDIDRISEICRRNNIWLHVDACHGGSLLFSNRLKKMIKGIENSDSISLDPHKGLFVTYSSSYVLFKRKETMNYFSRYPDKLYTNNLLDLGLVTPFYGSRGFESLKLWLLFNHIGIKNLGRLVEERSDVYLELVNLLENKEYFVFFNKPTFYRSAFVFYPKKIRDKVKAEKLDARIVKRIIDDYTVEFVNRLYESGDLVFDIFKLKDLDDKTNLNENEDFNVIGMSVGHTYISRDIIKNIDNIISEYGENVLLKMEEACSRYSVNSDNTYSISFSPASWGE